MRSGILIRGVVIITTDIHYFARPRVIDPHRTHTSISIQGLRHAVQNAIIFLRNRANRTLTMPLHNPSAQAQ